MLKGDALVVGAGVIGLAAARALQLAGRETILIDQEVSFGTQTSSRNSEVIHAGIYYANGSLKAQYCVAGKKMLYAYCRHKTIPHKRIGKLIIANSDREVAILATYKNQAEANGVHDLAWLDASQVAALEPAIQPCVGLFSPSTGIIDSHAYMMALLHDFEDAGGIFVRKAAFASATARSDGIETRLDDGTEIRVDWLINAAGHGAPSVARQIEGLPSAYVPRASYAIGHYYTLAGRSPFSRLIYPIAEAGGLGVHVTLDMSGKARFGPDVRWVESLDYAFDDSGRGAFVDAIRAYYPSLKSDDLEPAYTGIRPKIGGRDQPNLDFRIEGPDTHGVPGLVNLFGIESPGLTASLAIAEAVLFMTSATGPIRGQHPSPTSIS
jgi:L-2-hydroxyglutarate oxidase LhgO